MRYYTCCMVGIIQLCKLDNAWHPHHPGQVLDPIVTSAEGTAGIRDFAVTIRASWTPHFSSKASQRASIITARVEKRCATGQLLGSGEMAAGPGYLGFGVCACFPDWLDRRLHRWIHCLEKEKVCRQAAELASCICSWPSIMMDIGWDAWCCTTVGQPRGTP